MRKLQFCTVALIIVSLFTSCSKEVDLNATGREVAILARNTNNSGKGKPQPASSYITYTIRQGNHSCDQSTIKSVKTSEMKFAVIFDQSAIYTSLDPVNQYDINKLYGFSEGYNNQYNSARIGWNWYDEALHLHAYVYNKGVRQYQEITTVNIGAEILCSIKVSGNTYVFTVNGEQVVMSRGLTTSSASGYQQFPYFGGDEMAPHLITIKIKDL